MRKIKKFLAISFTLAGLFTTGYINTVAAPGGCTGTVFIGGDITVQAVTMDAYQNCPSGSAIAAMDIETGKTFWITVS